MVVLGTFEIGKPEMQAAGDCAESRSEATRDRREQHFFRSPSTCKAVVFWRGGEVNSAWRRIRFRNPRSA